MKIEKFEKIVKFGMPFDRRSDIPSKNYGIGSMQIWFILKGKKGAVQVMIGTQCYLNETIREYNLKGIDLFEGNKSFDCWNVGYHSPKPMYKGQSKMDCDSLNKGFCYDNISYLQR